MIESCQNFQRNLNPLTGVETQWCRGKLTNVECAGWSDFCKYPEKFVPTGRIPLSEVTFKNERISE